jgi:DNA-3-methyladenine glycosylase II
MKNDLNQHIGITSTLEQPLILTKESYETGLAYLADIDAELGWILKNKGSPPMWQREPGFQTLVYIILEQQVSLASARAAYERLKEAASPLTPAKFLTFDDQELKTIGFSRQKTGYCRLLAQAILDGRLELEALESMSNEAVRSTLLEMKGIGPWTVDIYLLMALRRQDIWPRGDLALVSAVQRAKRMEKAPTPDEMEAISKPWQPWQAVAARMLWHYYLSGFGDTSS